MNQIPNDRPAHYVSVDDSDARIERLWAGVSAVIERRHRRARWEWAGVTACALAGAAMLLFHLRDRPAPVAVAWEGAQLETTANALSVALADGSRLTLDPHSRIDVGERTQTAVKLVVARGRLACDVTHRTGRSFVVVAEGVEVRVVGTRFSVSNERKKETARVEIRVERGVVEVRSADRSAEVVRVQAGGSWSRVIPAARSAQIRDTATAPGATAVGTPTATGTAENQAPASGPGEEPPAVALLPSVAGEPLEAAKSAENPTAVPYQARSARDNDARGLFEQARQLWRAGHIKSAARAYQTLLSRHPSDPRAGLAAFELGRLRMDQLGDMRGAVFALKRAVALAPGSEFREDAVARLVAANAGAHDRPACERVRNQYLRDYPAGVHRRTVRAAACGPSETD